MRRLFNGIVAFGAAALLGGAAQAGPLSSATLHLELGAPTTALDFPANNTVMGTATSGTNATLASGSAFAGSGTVMVTGTVTKVQLIVNKNKKGVFTGATPAVSATFTGTANAFAGGLSSPLLKIPVALGKSVMTTVMGSGLKIVLTGHKWTAGMTTVSLGGGMTAMGTGFNNLTAGGNGSLKLVSASKITVPGITTTYSLGQLTIQYAPEPALPLMLVAGAATLGLVGSKKLRRR